MTPQLHLSLCICHVAVFFLHGSLKSVGHSSVSYLQRESDVNDYKCLQQGVWPDSATPTKIRLSLSM